MPWPPERVVGGTAWPPPVGGFGARERLGSRAERHQIENKVLASYGAIKCAHSSSSQKVNLEWVANLELLEVNDPPKPLPGATVRRVWSPDDRLVIRDAKDSDKITYYDSIAAVRDRKTLAIYVVFRETLDALFAQQKDPEAYPKWLMAGPADGRRCLEWNP
jgi:hypothetical protein